jgi:hypothetical protein
MRRETAKGRRVSFLAIRRAPVMRASCPGPIMPTMNQTPRDTTPASAMLERARQVLELTHREWQVRERRAGRQQSAQMARNHHSDISLGTRPLGRAYS